MQPIRQRILREKKSAADDIENKFSFQGRSIFRMEFAHENEFFSSVFFWQQIKFSIMTVFRNRFLYERRDSRLEEYILSESVKM